MKAFKLFALVFSLFVLNFGARASAYTATDYYNAGLQLYTAQNYQQAIQYFGAAISLDPNNAPALQGRANCYYALGQYSDALNDYQKVQVLSPSDQLAQFIQALQAKAGSAPPAAAPATTDSFSQGAALYQQQQYAAALPFFQKAVQDNPNDSKAFYYLGATQLMLGDKKDAAVALSLSNRLNPNPSVAAYSNQLIAGLSPDDQQWVDSQLAAPAPGPSSPAASVSAKPKSFGLRIEPAIALVGLGDFNANASAFTSNLAQLQTADSDPSLSYSGNVPQGAIDFGVEGVLPLSDQFELGIPISFFPVGKVTDAVNDSFGDTYTDSYDISAYAFGINLRYLIGTGSFQPFVSAGFLAVPIILNYSGSYNIPSLFPPSGTASGDFGSVGFGGQAQIGVDWHLDDTFVISPFVGYQLASAGSFTSTNNSNGQKVELETIPTAGGRVIGLVSEGNLVMPVFTSTQVLNPGTPVPAGAQPLTVDLSGLKAGVQISAFF